MVSPPSLKKLDGLNPPGPNDLFDRILSRPEKVPLFIEHTSPSLLPEPLVLRHSLFPPENILLAKAPPPKKKLTASDAPSFSLTGAEIRGFFVIKGQAQELSLNLKSQKVFGPGGLEMGTFTTQNLEPGYQFIDITWGTQPAKAFPVSQGASLQISDGWFGVLAKKPGGNKIAFGIDTHFFTPVKEKLAVSRIFADMVAGKEPSTDERDQVTLIVSRLQDERMAASLHNLFEEWQNRLSLTDSLYPVVWAFMTAFIQNEFLSADFEGRIIQNLADRIERYTQTGARMTNFPNIWQTHNNSRPAEQVVGSLRIRLLTWLQSPDLSLAWYAAQNLVAMEKDLHGKKDSYTFSDEVFEAILSLAITTEKQGAHGKGGIPSPPNLALLRLLKKVEISEKAKRLLISRYPELAALDSSDALEWLAKIFILPDETLTKTEVEILFPLMVDAHEMSKRWNEWAQDGSGYQLINFFYGHGFDTLRGSSLASGEQKKKLVLVAIEKLGTAGNARALDLAKNVLDRLIHIHWNSERHDWLNEQLRQLPAAKTPAQTKAYTAVKLALKTRHQIHKLVTQAHDGKIPSESELSDLLNSIRQLEWYNDTSTYNALKIIAENKNTSAEILEIIGEWMPKAMEALHQGADWLKKFYDDGQPVLAAVAANPNTQATLRQKIARYQASLIIKRGTRDEPAVFKSIRDTVSMMIDAPSADQFEAGWEAFMDQTDQLHTAWWLDSYERIVSSPHIQARHLEAMTQRTLARLDEVRSDVGYTKDGLAFLRAASLHTRADPALVAQTAPVLARYARKPRYVREADSGLAAIMTARPEAVPVAVQQEWQHRQLEGRFIPDGIDVKNLDVPRLEQALEAADPRTREGAARDARWLVTKKALRYDPKPADRLSETPWFELDSPDELFRAMALLARSSADSDGPTANEAKGSLGVAAFLVEHKQAGRKMPNIYVTFPQNPSDIEFTIPSGLKQDPKKLNAHLRHLLFEKMAIIPVNATREFSNEELQTLIETLQKIPYPLLKGVLGLFSEQTKPDRDAEAAYAESKFLHFKERVTAATVYHEAAHLMWSHVLTDAQKEHFTKLYAEAKQYGPMALPSSYAGKNVGEGFAEMFAEWMKDGAELLRSGIEQAKEGYPARLEMTLFFVTLCVNQKKAVPVYSREGQIMVPAINVVSHKNISVKTADFSRFLRPYTFGFNSGDRLNLINGILIPRHGFVP